MSNAKATGKGKVVKLTRMQSIMKLSGQGVRDQRNAIQYKRLSGALNTKLTSLNDQKDEISLKIFSLTDLAPNSKDSLKIKDVNAENWLEELADAYAQQRDIDDTIEVYEAIKEDFFTPKTAAELAELAEVSEELEEEEA